MLFVMMLFLACSDHRQATLTFEVRAPAATDSTRIFVTGDHELLGDWNPRAVELHRENSSELFKRSIKLPKQTSVEFKFTRGSWDTERLLDDGEIPANSHLSLNSDTTFSLTINRWRDQGIKFKGQITGDVRYHRGLSWPGIQARDVIVWLPPDYAIGHERYATLYMHDGQNIFDPATSYLGFDWRADEVADSLIRAQKMEPIIIVGIYNTTDRTADYSDTQTGRAYQKFIIEMLKPMIDQTYRTKRGPENTGVMGSSMGGLASFLLAWRYPHIFGKAGCLSPAFIKPFDGAVAIVRKTRAPRKIKLYIDNGGAGLETKLQPGCDAMLDALREAGFQDGKNLAWFKDSVAEHNEKAWAKRLWRPLEFLYPAISADH